MKLKTPHCEYLYVKVSKSRKQITYDVFWKNQKHHNLLSRFTDLQYEAKKVRAVRLHYIYTSSPRYTIRAADLDRASFYEQSATIVNGLSRASTCCSTRPAASKPQRGGGGGCAAAATAQSWSKCQKSAKSWILRFVKLTGHNYACNRLTNF